MVSERGVGGVSGGEGGVLGGGGSAVTCSLMRHYVSALHYYRVSGEGGRREYCALYP